MAAALETRWAEFVFEAPWLGDRERRRALRLVHGIAAYLRDREAAGFSLVAGEQRFVFTTGRASVHGSVDRIERDPDGRLLVIDLKTGKPSGQINQKAAATNAQLGVYQLAVRTGAVPECPPELDLAGARLLYVDVAGAAPFKEVHQAALDAETAATFAAKLESVAEGMGAAVFQGPVDPDDRRRTDRAARMIRIGEVCGD